MKKIICALLFSSLTIVGFSQNQRINDLKQKLAIAETDTSRVWILSNLCNSLTGSNPDSALYYGEKAVALARKIKFHKGEILALSYTSGVFMSTGNLPKALSTAFEALQIAESNHLEKSKKWPFVFIASVYKSLKDFPRAISFRKKALMIAEADKDTISMSIENRSLGAMYIDVRKLDSASFYLNKALVLTNGKGNTLIFLDLGDIQAKQGNFTLAMEYYKKALKKTDQTNNHRNNSHLYISIANLFKNRNQRDSSIYFAEKALEESQQIHFKLNIIEASTLLSELYEPISDKDSYHYYKLAMTNRESLFGAGNIQAIQEMIALEEERKKEAARAKAAFQNQLTQYALLAGLALLLLIALLLYRNNRKEKKARNLLQAKNEKIQLTLSQLKSTQSQLIQSEKMASLGELTAGIAHEIQNPLNFVNNFSEVNTELIAELKAESVKPKAEWDESLIKETLDNLNDNEQKINHHGKRAADIVKGMLQHSRSSSGVKEPTDINALADEYLRLAYHGLRAKDKSFNATLNTDYDDSIGNINIVPQDMGRVILNLITNAFYAVNEKLKA